METCTRNCAGAHKANRRRYPLDKYEAAAYLVTGALHLPVLSPQEAWVVGKRINNVIGASGTIGGKLKALRKRGMKSTISQCAALLQATATLNLQPSARPPKTSTSSYTESTATPSSALSGTSATASLCSAPAKCAIASTCYRVHAPTSD